MADIVYMAKAKWKSLLNAIRTKAGTTDAMTVDTATTAVNNITTGSTTGSGTSAAKNVIPKEYAEGTITDLVVEDGTTKIKYGLFDSERDLDTVLLPNTITTIEDNAFAFVTLLKMTQLPNSLQTLGAYAFANTWCTFTELPHTMREVGMFAFMNCPKLTSVTIHSPISFGAYAFSSCVNLKEIVIDYDHTTHAMCTFDTDVFQNTPIAIDGTGVIKVPYEKLADYKAATNLTVYKNNIIASVHDLISMSMSLSRPRISIVASHNTVTATITYNEYGNCPESQKGVTWSVTGHATVSADGVITTTAEAAAGDVITVTATSTYNNKITATATLSVINLVQSISVNGNGGQWIDSGIPVNGCTVYKSDAGSYNVNNGISTAAVTVKGYKKIVLYVKQSSEQNFDFVEVGAVDADCTRTLSTNLYKAQGKDINTWYQVTVTIPDTGEHYFKVIYSKDGSGDRNEDRGYFYIAEKECE